MQTTGTLSSRVKTGLSRMVPELTPGSSGRTVEGTGSQLSYEKHVDDWKQQVLARM